MSQEIDHHDIEYMESNDCLVKLSGLSSSTSREDIKKFFHPLTVISIDLFGRKDDSSVESFVRLESEVDISDAIRKTGRYLDNRPIKINRASEHEFDFYRRTNGKISWIEPVLRMSGLPSGCTMATVQLFFDGSEIARNGIYIARDMTDKALGDGYVAFVNMNNAYKAMNNHDRKQIEDRCIELYASSYDEAKQAILNDAHINAKQFTGEDDDEHQEEDHSSNMKMNNHRSRSVSRHRSRSISRDRQTRNGKHSRSSPLRSRPLPKRSNYRLDDDYGRRSRSRSPVRRSSDSNNRNQEYLIKMRGMPYDVVEKDIRKFFPGSCQPKRIEIEQDRDRKRSNGNGYVYFNSLDEAKEAMKCDRKYMGSRYIELYFDSPRQAATNFRRKRSPDSQRRSSPVPVKPRSNYRRRSSSDSDD